MNWFKRKPKIQVEVVRSTEIRLVQWKASPELVGQARRIFALQEFRAMLDCVRTESPSNYSLPLTGVSADDRVTHALHIEGYNLCLNNLEALCKFEKEAPAFDAEFKPENTMAQPIPLEDAPYVIPKPDYQPKNH